MERVCQQLPSAEPHQREAGRPVLTAFRPFSFSAVNVVVVDPSGNKCRMAGRSVLHKASGKLSVRHESCVISRWQSELCHQRAVTVCVCVRASVRKLVCS